MGLGEEHKKSMKGLTDDETAERQGNMSEGSVQCSI